MKTFFPARFLFTAVTAGALLIVHAVYADEEAELARLSPAAQKTVHKAVGSSKITEVEPAFVDGKHATEVEFKRGGKEMAIVVSPEGKLIQTEERMSPKDAPEPFRNAVLKQYPKAAITHIKSIDKNGQVSFEISVSADGKTHELKLDKNGKPLKSGAKD